MKGNWHRLSCVLVAVISHSIFWGFSSSRGDVESGNVVCIAGGDVVGMYVSCWDVAGAVDGVGGVVSRRVLAGEVLVNGGV